MVVLTDGMAGPEMGYPALEGMHDTLKESHHACVVKVHNFGVIYTRQEGVEGAEKYTGPQLKKEKQH
jgi:hypothetical protein